LDEVTQTRMIKLLLEHGADESKSVENLRPADLVKADRVHALAALSRQGSVSNRLQDPRYPELVGSNPTIS
jgi:hypothetical protein